MSWVVSAEQAFPTSSSFPLELTFHGHVNLEIALGLMGRGVMVLPLSWGGECCAPLIGHIQWEALK